MAIIFPNYQSIVFNQKAQCKKCDLFYYDKDKDLQFQYQSKYEEKVNVDFTQTPYPQIPEDTDWLIDIPPLPIGTLSPIRSSFLLQNSQRTRLYVIYDDADANITSTLFDSLALGIRVIRIKYDANDATMRSRIANTINSGFGAEAGVTANNTGTSVKISNMPAGIGFDYWNMNANINTPNPALFQFKHFIDNLVWSPIAKKMYWLNMPKYYKNQWEGNGSYLTVNDLDFTGMESKNVQVKLKYENNNAFDLQIRVAIKIDGWFLGTWQWYTMPANSTGEIVHTRLMPAGFSPSNLPFSAGIGQIELIPNDPAPGNLHNAPELSFSIDDITLECKDTVLSIDKKTCDNNLQSITYNINENNANGLITIDKSELQNAIQIIINTSNGVFSSNLFKLIDVENNCFNLLKLNWSSNCKFDILDYQNLPFMNELYFKGYTKMVDNRETDNVFYRDFNGREYNVFGISIEQIELFIANYTNVLHTLLSRALMNENIFINDEQYSRNEQSKYTTADLENGTYTARIQLSKVGSEVLNSSCCC